LKVVHNIAWIWINFHLFVVPSLIQTLRQTIRSKYAISMARMSQTDTTILVALVLT
jgi:hypothetical protein